MRQREGVHPADVAIERLASAQCGRFTRAQVASVLPNPRSFVQTRVRSGRWRSLTSKVLSLPGAPDDAAGDLWTAILHLGPLATVSHTSAGGLHRLPALEMGGPPTLTVPNGAPRTAGRAVVHQSRDLTSDQVVTVAGLSVTSVPRTLIDLAPTASRPRIDTWLDHLATERRLRLGEIGSLLDRLHGPGKRGLGPLIDAVGERLPGDGVEQGKLERALTAVLRTALLGDGVAQFPHPGRPDGGALVDRAFPDARLIVEADGRTWHERRLAMLADARRDRAAAEVGWQTIRYLHADLVRSPDASAEEVRAIHDRRLLDLWQPGARADR